MLLDLNGGGAPSPLKSPLPTIDQLLGTLPTPAVVPFISQIATLPLVSRHRMFHLPSP